MISDHSCWAKWDFHSTCLMPEDLLLALGTFFSAHFGHLNSCWPTSTNSLSFVADRCHQFMTASLLTDTSGRITHFQELEPSPSFSMHQHPGFTLLNPCHEEAILKQKGIETSTTKLLRLNIQHTTCRSIVQESPKKKELTPYPSAVKVGLCCARQ